MSLGKQLRCQTSFLNLLKEGGVHLALLVNFHQSRLAWRRVAHNL